MIDTHCHLDFPEFKDSLDEVLSQAQQALVTHYIIPATQELSWQGLNLLAQKYSSIYVAYGIHPWFLAGINQADLLGNLAHYLQTDKCVAVGECGLDFYHGRQDEALQKKVLELQMKLAVKIKLPIILHSRKAVEEVFNLCRKHHVTQGVFHGFSGSIEQAYKIIETGFYIGVGGIVCQPKATKTHKMLVQIPLENIVLETDSPDQTLNKGQRGTPADIIPIAKALATLHHVSFEAVMVQCELNAKACFKIETR